MNRQPDTSAALAPRSWAAFVARAILGLIFSELVCGALMLAGWRRRIAALGLGGVLILVTFGHLLAEPLYVFSAHVIPRTLLLVIVLLLSRTTASAWTAGSRAALFYDDRRLAYCFRSHERHLHAPAPVGMET